MEKKLQIYPAEVALAMSRELNRLRVASGITVADLAARAYASGNYVNQILKGQKNASKDMYAAICKALNVNQDELLQKIEADMGRTEPVEGGNTTEPVEAETVEVEKVVERCMDAKDGVLVDAQQEDLYRVFLFCEERMADNLQHGTAMPPEELYRLMKAMYALRDAALRAQEGEQIAPASNGQ